MDSEQYAFILEFLKTPFWKKLKVAENTYFVTYPNQIFIYLHLYSGFEESLGASTIII